jgi:hypothetical protein
MAAHPQPATQSLTYIGISTLCSILRALAKDGFTLADAMLSKPLWRFDKTRPIWGKIHTTTPHIMTLKSHKPRFERRPVHGIAPRMLSYCTACGEFIAASDKPKNLRIAEKAHICPQPKRKH